MASFDDGFLQHQMEKMSKDGLLALLFLLKGKSASSTKGNAKNFIVAEIAEHLAKLSVAGEVQQSSCGAQGSGGSGQQGDKGDGGDDKKGGDRGDGGNDKKGGVKAEDDDTEEEDGNDMWISVRMPDGQSCRYKMGDRSKVMFLKFQIKLNTGIPRHEQRLIFSDQTLEDRKSLADYGIKDEDTVHLQLRILGDGKRGRGEKNKASRLAEFREDAGTAMLRITASPTTAPGIQDVVNVCTEITAQLNTPIAATIVTWMIGRTSDAKLRELNTCCTTSNAMETRMSVVTDNFFSTQKGVLAELNLQIKKCEDLMSCYSHMAMMSQYGDDSGNIHWTEFTREVTATLERRGYELGAAAAGAAHVHGIGG